MKSLARTCHKVPSNLSQVRRRSFADLAFAFALHGGDQKSLFTVGDYDEARAVILTRRLPSLPSINRLTVFAVIPLRIRSIVLDSEPHAFLPKVLARGFQVTGIDKASVVRANVLSVFRRQGRHVELLHAKHRQAASSKHLLHCFELWPFAQGPRRSGTPSRLVARESAREGGMLGSASCTCLWLKSPVQSRKFRAFTAQAKSSGFPLAKCVFCIASCSLKPVLCCVLQRAAPSFYTSLEHCFTVTRDPGPRPHTGARRKLSPQMLAHKENAFQSSVCRVDLTFSLAFSVNVRSRCLL